MYIIMSMGVFAQQLISIYDLQSAMSLLDDDIRRYSVYYGIIFAIASAVFIIIVWATGVPSDVKDCYFVYADAMMNGVMPYTPGTGLSWEYPPFSYVFMFIPRIFASTATGYEIGFVIEVIIFFVLGLLVTGKIAIKLRQGPYLPMLVYSILMLVMFEFLTDRFDIFTAVMTLFSVYLFFFTDKKWLAFVILTIAAATKLYPALLIPLFIILLGADRKWKDVAIGGAAVSITTLLIMIPFILTGVEYMMFLQYHTDRPLEVESVASSIIMIASMLGLTQSYVGFDFGSDNLYGPWADAIGPYMTWIFVIVVIILYFVFASYAVRAKRQKIDIKLQLVSVFGFMIILSFFLFGKVISGQYPIWLIPFALLIVMVFSNENTMKSKLFLCFLASEAFTQLNFAVNYGLRDKGEDFSDIGIIILFIRNILLILCFLLALYVLRRNIGPIKGVLNEKISSNI